MHVVCIYALQVWAGFKHTMCYIVVVVTYHGYHKHNMYMYMALYMVCMYQCDLMFELSVNNNVAIATQNAHIGLAPHLV